MTYKELYQLNDDINKVNAFISEKRCEVAALDDFSEIPFPLYIENEVVDIFSRTKELIRIACDKNIEEL